MLRMCDIKPEMITFVLVTVMVILPFVIGLTAGSGVAIYRNRGKK